VTPNPFTKCGWEDTVPRGFSMLYLLLHAERLVAEREKETGTVFEVVVRLRPDMCAFSPLKLPWPLDKNTLYQGYWTGSHVAEKDFGRIKRVQANPELGSLRRSESGSEPELCMAPNDIFGYGDRETMREYARTFRRLPHIAQLDSARYTFFVQDTLKPCVKYFPENAIGHALHIKDTKCWTVFDFGFTITRTDGPSAACPLQG
jgi:hypothetical protein